MALWNRCSLVFSLTGSGRGLSGRHAMTGREDRCGSISTMSEDSRLGLGAIAIQVWVLGMEARDGPEEVEVSSEAGDGARAS